MAANKDEGDLERLRILVSDGKGHRPEEVTHTVTSLGHEVVGHSSLGEVAASTASIRPDAAIVIVGESAEHALELIGRTVTEAVCPVIAILDVEDEAFIRDAAKRGIFAYITLGRDASALQSSLDVVLSRFAEYHGRRVHSAAGRVHCRVQVETLIRRRLEESDVRLRVNRALALTSDTHERFRATIRIQVPGVGLVLTRQERRSDASVDPQNPETLHRHEASMPKKHVDTSGFGRDPGDLSEQNRVILTGKVVWRSELRSHAN